MKKKAAEKAAKIASGEMEAPKPKPVQMSMAEQAA
jgi:hypothetical protein